MPYTDDPLNVPSDQVRVLVGDTGATPDLTDNTIAYLLSEENDNSLRAAARAAEMLSAKYTKIASEKRVGPLTLIQGSRMMTKAQEFTHLARLLWNRAARGIGPVAPGISRSEKNAAIQDSDRVRPAFGRRMMQYPTGTGDYNNADREDLLSPPSEVL